MNQNTTTQVLVIGGGPGGYVAAIRAGQLGLKTTLVETGKLGGTCLIRGCIPSKALIHVATRLDEMAIHVKEPHLGIRLAQKPAFELGQAVRWKDGIVERLNGGVAQLLKKAGVDVIQGWATFSDAKHCEVETSAGTIQIRAENVILANGSEARALSDLPFSERVLSSTSALDLTHVPETLAVVGAGYIGLELGIAFSRMGSRVNFIEAGDRILPQYDPELTRPVATWLKDRGVEVHLQTKVEALGKGGLVAVSPDGQKVEIPAEKVLVTVGRGPQTGGWGLENMQVDMAGSFIKVDGQCRTSMKGVFAIGDLVGEPMLAHKASAQGEMVAEILAGHKRVFDPRAIPAICFTEPEIVGVGLSPDDARAQGYEITVGHFPLMANGRALVMEADAGGGFVRVTARKDNHLVLGIHAVGRHVAELSGEFVHALEMGACLEDIAGTIHAHPTMSEAFHEAALASLGHAIHI